MMREVDKICRDLDFYRNHTAGEDPNEARAVLIGMYAENELDSALKLQVKQHLEVCPSCGNLLTEIRTIEEFKQSKEPVFYAVCPSSRLLDGFVFNKGELAEAIQQQITHHLRECPLCREETDWLRTQTEQKVIQFPKKSAPARFLAVAAAVFFFLTTAFLFFQQIQTNPPDRQLQALAVIPEPHEIDFDQIDSMETLPGEMASVYNQGRQLFQQGNFEQAAAHFERVTNRTPEHAASLFLLSYSYYKMNQPQKAFDVCRKAENIRPHSYQRCLFLVKIALKTRNYDVALTELSVLRHELPESTEVQDLYNRMTELMRGRKIKI